MSLFKNSLYLEGSLVFRVGSIWWRWNCRFLDFSQQWSRHNFSFIVIFRLLYWTFINWNYIEFPAIEAIWNCVRVQCIANYLSCILAATIWDFGIFFDVFDTSKVPNFTCFLVYCFNCFHNLYYTYFGLLNIFTLKKIEKWQKMNKK